MKNEEICDCEIIHNDVVKAVRETLPKDEVWLFLSRISFVAVSATFSVIASVSVGWVESV